MRDIFLIDSLETLRALSDPLRLRIIEALRAEPLTTSQVARQLNQKPNKLHYHILELERNGLIEVVETRQKGNLLEKYYRPVANVFHVDRGLFERNPGPEALSVFYQNAVTTLDITAADLKAALDAGRLTEKETASALHTLMRWRLSPEDAAEFQRRTRELIAEFSRKSRPDASSFAALTLLFYTLAPEQAPTEATGEPPTL